MKPSDFKPMHNGERFQTRMLNGEWQLYSAELEHIALCDRSEIADMIAKCLNDAAEGVFHYSLTGEGIKPRQVDCD